MARTHGRIKVEVWEAGSDYRQLSLPAQWAYQMLVSQPAISMCGTLSYTPKKWAKLARGLTVDEVEAAVRELEDGWYLIVDRDTDELLIRTFVKHDKPWQMPNLVTAARRQFREVESDTIRGYLADRHPWLVDDAQDPKEWEETQASRRTSERTLPLLSERPSGRPPPARAGTRTAPSPTPGPSPRTTEKAAAENEGSTSSTQDRPAGWPDDQLLDPAAAADDPWTAPTDAQIERAVDRLSGADPGTFKIIYPLARALSQRTFLETVARHQARRSAGVGLLITFLRDAIRARQHELAQANPPQWADSLHDKPDKEPPDIEAALRTVIPTIAHHPDDKFWDFVRGVIAAETDDEDERRELTDIAADLRRP